MLRKSLTLSLALTTTLALFGCNKDDKAATTRTTAAEYSADNTAQNARDQNGAPTPMDQSNAPADLETTQRIRQALVFDDSLSSDAKNVKVITAGGTVTLRGPVPSEAERVAVEGKALQLAGQNRLKNELDVEAR
jgi:hyperosmotically inducible periplasmic protein